MRLGDAAVRCCHNKFRIHVVKYFSMAMCCHTMYETNSYDCTAHRVCVAYWISFVDNVLEPFFPQNSTIKLISTAEYAFYFNSFETCWLLFPKHEYCGKRESQRHFTIVCEYTCGRLQLADGEKEEELKLGEWEISCSFAYRHRHRLESPWHLAVLKCWKKMDSLMGTLSR